MKSDIVLQTDFGLTTGFVGSMTGVIRKVDQSLCVFDLNHEIRPFDMKQASGLLADTVMYWKDGTVFVSVVDPGVGTARKSCVALLDNGSYVVTPDNGTLTGIKDRIVKVREIDETVNRLPGSERANTFHGRDVYAYTAARLASGVIDYSGVGPEYPTSQIVTFSIPKCKISEQRAEGIFTGCLKQYGSPTTNIGVLDFEKAGFKYGDMINVRISRNGKSLYSDRVLFHKSFGYVPEGAPIICNGSTSPYIEISLNLKKFADRFIPDIYEENPESFEVVFCKTAELYMQTDFGPGGGSAMFGVCKSVEKSLIVRDISHEIPKFDVKAASESLLKVIPQHPQGTVFVSVVDPGVGTSRRACVALLGNGSYIVTPDNGTLALPAEKWGIKSVRVIDEKTNRLPGTEKTSIFHGRDLFAYCGSRLAAGVISFEQVGPEYNISEVVQAF